MGITVNGNITVKGDQVFDGGIKIVHQYGQAEKKGPLTKEILKENVDCIRHKLVNGRLWFSVCKYMMLEGMVPEGDFKQAVEILGELYPDETFNAADLSRLNVLSFRKPFNEWDEKDCPIKDRTTFYTHQSIGITLSQM